ncbi:serine hydrolase-like protein [Melitaea cinxia]|uniref:serine hydrolase-like protein n=1 Tax=Melitaea cinxia TaxID=113334 RepID=UPI001E26FE04|nr:serine hydrolase-like protein [Melitaea cinxia]
MRLLNEWFFDAPWGKIALISWGNENGAPVLLVHGRQDSAATFLPLLEYLPDDHYYVGLDMPGHGKSDQYPIGTALTRFFGVFVIDITIKHLKWEEFKCIGHSMGAAHTLFYNALYPGQIKKMVLLDPGPALQYLVTLDLSKLYSSYEGYYNNYTKINSHNRVYTMSEALQAVMRARGMTKKQAQVILSRNLRKVGEDQYRLSWDRRLHNYALMNYTPEYCYELFTKSSPPTLYIIADQNKRYEVTKERLVADEIVRKVSRNVKNFFIVHVEGGHDLHFLNPELIGEDVCEFLKRDFTKTKSKL